MLGARLRTGPGKLAANKEYRFQDSYSDQEPVRNKDQSRPKMVRKHGRPARRPTLTKADPEPVGRIHRAVNKEPVDRQSYAVARNECAVPKRNVDKVLIDQRRVDREQADKQEPSDVEPRPHGVRAP